MERYHLALRVIHAQLQHIVNVFLGILTGTQLHLIDTSELHEIIDIRLSQIVRQSRKHLIQVQIHQLHLVTIDVQIELRHIGLIHTAERSNGRLRAIFRQQGIDRLLQFFRTQRLSVFQLELKSARGSQARNDRRNDTEHLSLLHQGIGFPIETVHHRLCRMFLSRTLLPVLQHHKVRCRIGKLASTHHTETIHPQEGLDFGILLQDGINLPAHRLGSFQRRCRRKLDRHHEIAIVFLGHKGGRPLHEKQKGDDGKHHKRTDSHHRTSQQPLD